VKCSKNWQSGAPLPLGPQECMHRENLFLRHSQSSKYSANSKIFREKHDEVPQKNAPWSTVRILAVRRKRRESRKRHSEHLYRRPKISMANSIKMVSHILWVLITSNLPGPILGVTTSLLPTSVYHPDYLSIFHDWKSSIQKTGI